jgi:hypothetical protein
MLDDYKFCKLFFMKKTAPFDAAPVGRYSGKRFPIRFGCELLTKDRAR